MKVVVGRSSSLLGGSLKNDEQRKGWRGLSYSPPLPTSAMQHTYPRLASSLCGCSMSTSVLGSRITRDLQGDAGGLGVWHKLSIQGLRKNHISPESRVCARPPASPCRLGLTRELQPRIATYKTVGDACSRQTTEYFTSNRANLFVEFF